MCVWRKGAAEEEGGGEGSLEWVSGVGVWVGCDGWLQFGCCSRTWCREADNIATIQGSNYSLAPYL